MNRRKFVKSSVISSAGIAVMPTLFSFSTVNSEDSDSITILHTNDTHSNLDPFPNNHAKYAGRGGVAKRMELIQQIRATNKNVLLLDSGDIFQGTPYFNKFGGTLEMKLMTELGYDAATMGNHDFDGGMDGFLAAKKYADFPFICSNYDFSNTILKGETTDYYIFNKGKFRIGVFGLGVELDGLVSKNLYLDTVYHSPITIANNTANKLKNDLKCDLVICLSHLGYSYASNKISDVVLAEKTSNIDLILGGHTHTFLDNPTILNNVDDEKVLVNQVGWAGLNLGRIDFYFSKNKSKRNKPSNIEL